MLGATLIKLGLGLQTPLFVEEKKVGLLQNLQDAIMVRSRNRLLMDHTYTLKLSKSIF